MQILNQRDYRSAKARLAQLEASLTTASVIDNLTNVTLSAELTTARQQALKAEREKLSREIQSYENLQASGEFSDEVRANELGLLPIVARVARRMSQKDLADRLEVSEQQIQRYESDRYATISLARYQRLLNILGVAVRSRLNPLTEDKAENRAAEIIVDSMLLAALRKHNVVQIPKGTSEEGISQILGTYIAEGEELIKGRALHKRRVRQEAVINETALQVWQSIALRKAVAERHKIKSRFNIVDTSWLSKLVRLSSRADGPKLAAELLREKGIILVTVQHLPHTLLDGAAMLLADGTPVIALTLRYDRLDSFWFTLLHEIGHVILHFNHGLDVGFIDNLDEIGDSSEEREADIFALSATIPDSTWETAPARFSRSSELVKKFANGLEIHPAIVAGRIRKERQDYKIFSDLVGSGLVRPQFADQFE